MRFVGDPDDVPDFVAARDHVINEVVTFARALRRAGVDVPANAGILGARAFVAVGFDEKDPVKIALRAALVSRHEDIPVFDRLFEEFWRRLNEGPGGAGEPAEAADAPEGSLAPVGALDPDARAESMNGDPDDPNGTGSDPAAVDSLGRRVASTDAGEGPEADSVTTSVYSPTGRPSVVEVPADMVRQDDDLAWPLARLTAAIAGLRGRRWASGGEERIDTRRALRRSFSTGGTVLSVPERQRKQAAVRAMLLVDVSQSVLDTIDRGFLVRFLRRVAEEWRGVRIFFFDTSVREVTEEFDEPTPTDAIAALEQAETEWGGGTRIGNALSTIRDEEPDAVDRDTVAFVISDGLEVGEIDVLEDGMSWLARRAEAVLWLNPLAGSPEYEPTCRGMEVSVPYIDGLFSFAGPDDIAEMARQIERQGLHGRLGFEYDPRRTAPTV